MKKMAFAVSLLIMMYSYTSAQTNPFPTEIDLSTTISHTIISNGISSSGQNPNAFPVFTIFTTTGNEFAILLDGSLKSEKLYAALLEAKKGGKIVRFYSPANPRYYYAHFGNYSIGPYRELTVLWENAN